MDVLSCSRGSFCSCTRWIAHAAGGAILGMLAGAVAAAPTVYLEGVTYDVSAGTPPSFQNSGSVSIDSWSSKTLGPWGVSLDEAGHYRGKPFLSTIEADLSTGVLRQRLDYSGGTETDQLSSYVFMTDVLTFHGSGSAQIAARLTGQFTGLPHPTYYNYFDFTVGANRLEPTTDGFEPVAGVQGTFNLRNRFADEVALGNNCGATWSLGTVACRLDSLATEDIDITLSLDMAGISGGDIIELIVLTQAGVYDLNQGGADFGNTARLSLTTSPGLTWDSSQGSGVFLQTPVPEPGSWALMVAGLGVAGALARRRR